MSADVTFSLRNIGLKSVRVLSVESGCGCVVPSVTPTTVQAGQLCRVEARGTPLDAGEKTVAITLHTDSKTRPDIVLNLRMLGGRKPPFLLSATGNMTYLGVIGRDESRDLVAYTIEDGRATKPPVVRSDLPFLDFKLVGVESGSYGEDGIYSHKYHWRVTFNGPPPPEEFTGAVTIRDPWDVQRVERIDIHGRPNPPLRVVPLSPTLEIDGSDPSATKTSLAIITSVDAEDLQVELEGADSPLQVEKLTGGQTKRFGRFTVGWKPERPIAVGEYRLIARSASANLAHTFRVTVRTKGE